MRTTRRRLRSKRLARELDRGERLLPLDRREIVEEGIEAGAGDEMVEESTERHSGSDEDRPATGDLRVAVDDGVGRNDYVALPPWEVSGQIERWIRASPASIDRRRP